MLIEGKTDGKEVTVNMQEVSYGRIMQEINLTGNLTYTQSPHVYSYFEKGCRIKCTRQPRKVLWVVLSSLFFKEI